MSPNFEIFSGNGRGNIGGNRATETLKAGSYAMTTEPARLEILSALGRKVLWLSSWTIHHANHIRPNVDGLKVGGHQASSASLVTIMSALHFSVLRREERVAVKPQG